MIAHSFLSPLPPPSHSSLCKGGETRIFSEIYGGGGGGAKGEIQCFVAVQCGELVEALFSILNELQK